MENFINSVRSLLWFNGNTKKQRLDKVLKIATQIADQNPAALPDFVRLLGRKLQNDYMRRTVSWLGKERVPNLEPRTVWFDPYCPLNETGDQLFDLRKECNTSRELKLASDLVLPWPWNVDRVVKCISHIGADRRAGEWKQDYSNHKVEYWLPFGIGWVLGGNHSIMSGIVQAQGVIVTKRVYDISPLFSHVRFTGDAFVRISDDTVINKVSEFEFAAVFEVGRLMHERGITA